MKIALGCDPNAAELLDRVKKFCEESGYSVDVLGTEDEIYANTAIKVAEAVAAQKYDRGILICGTGIGMSIAANKVQGAYAALVSDIYSAKRAVLSNDSNILCLGAFTIGEKLAIELINTWLLLKFDPDCPSGKKVQRYKMYDYRI